MYSPEKLNIWLAYVSYPVTTAVYFERALRKKYNVFTIGPQITPEIIEDWKLENMKLEVTPHDIPVDFNVNIDDAINLADAELKPDIFIWIESIEGYFPNNIQNLNLPTACYLIDSHIKLKKHIAWASQFDYVFIAQKEYLSDFKNAGINNVYWLPLGCDPEIHNKFSNEKIHEIGFVGGIHCNPRREKMLGEFEEKGKLYYERCFWTDMAKVFSESKIVFNNAVRNDLNMRVFEVMSAGSLLLTDNPKNSGQDEMFNSNEDLVVYNDHTIHNLAEFYLENDELREAIAERGRQIVHNAHKYEDRVDEMIKVILKEKKDTPSTNEWRERSLENLTVSEKDIYKLKRSFVIPVLDYSPASPFNINTLLKSFENIEGNVIIVFNNEEVADEIKNHPRIDYYTIMKKNVGVARAWNIGLHMSQTPVTFILNADLTITKETVDKLEEHLLQLPDAAVVGPQGSYFNFHSCKDLMYLNKGTYNSPTLVDAVSGFLFAVKTKYFHDGTLIFENKFTPCYFEEWDTGLQIKRAGLKSWAVPCTGYEHEWSGSIRALRTIKYLDKEETAGEILDRNRKIFLEKWRKIDEDNLKSGNKTLLDSYLLEVINNQIDTLVTEKNIIEAEELLKLISSEFPNDLRLLTNLGVVEYYKNNIDSAKEIFEKILTIDPAHEIAKENLGTIMSELDVKVQN